jgi:serine/threonine protein kinase
MQKRQIINRKYAVGPRGGFQVRHDGEWRSATLTDYAGVLSDMEYALASQHQRTRRGASLPMSASSSVTAIGRSQTFKPEAVKTRGGATNKNPKAATTKSRTQYEFEDKDDVASRRSNPSDTSASDTESGATSTTKLLTRESKSRGGDGGGEDDSSGTKTVPYAKFVSTHQRESERESSEYRARQLAAFGAAPFPTEKFAPRSTWTKLGGGTNGIVYAVRDVTTGERVALKEVEASNVDNVLNETFVLRHLARHQVDREHKKKLSAEITTTEVTTTEITTNEVTTALGDRKYAERYVRSKSGDDSPVSPLLTLRNVYEWRSPAAAGGHSFLIETESLDAEKGYVPMSDLLGDSSDIVKERKAVDLVAVTQNLLRALTKLHAAGVAHRDIKPDNILVHLKSAHIKLIDFGESCYDCASRERGAARGSPLTMAPELLVPIISYRASPDLQYTLTMRELQETDLWSAGLTIMWLLTNVAPNRLFYEPSTSRIHRGDSDTKSGRRRNGGGGGGGGDEQNLGSVAKFFAQENGTGITSRMWTTALTYISDPKILRFVTTTVQPLLDRASERRGL